MTVKNHVSLIGNATGTEKSVVLNAKSISWITNHGSEPVYINFEEGVTTSGTFRLATAETITNINTPVGTIYYISTGASASTAAFSLFGIAR